MADLAVLPPAGGYYDVLIRRNADGVERLSRVDWDWFRHGDGGDLYWWTDGNFGCDCNRGLEFSRAGGEEDLYAECGGSAYTVVKAILPDGREIEIDGAREPPREAFIDSQGIVTVTMIIPMRGFTGFVPVRPIIDGQAEDISGQALEGPKGE